MKKFNYSKLLFIPFLLIFIFSCRVSVRTYEDVYADNKLEFTDGMTKLKCNEDSFTLHIDENFDDKTEVEELFSEKIDERVHWKKMTWFGASTSGLKIENNNLVFQSFRGKPGDDRYEDMYKDDPEYKDGGGFQNGALYFQAKEPYGYYEAEMKFAPREYSGGWGCYYAYWNDAEHVNVYEYDFIEERGVDIFDVTVHWHTENKPGRRTLTWNTDKESLFRDEGWKTVGQYHKVGFLWTEEKCIIFINDKIIYALYEDNRNGLIPRSYVRTSRKAGKPLISDQAMMFLLGAASSNAKTSLGAWVPMWTGHPSLPLFGTAPENYRYDHLFLKSFKYYKWDNLKE